MDRIDALIALIDNVIQSEEPSWRAVVPVPSYAGDYSFNTDVAVFAVTVVPDPEIRLVAPVYQSPVDSPDG